MAHAKNPSVENCINLFGQHPECVINPIKTASDSLFWLEEIFKTIARESLTERNSYRIKRLSEIGAYLAFDLGNTAGCQHDTLTERLRVGGVISSEGSLS